MTENRAKISKISEKSGKKPRICAKRPEKPQKPEKSRSRLYYEQNQERLKEAARSRYAEMTPAERAMKRWRTQAIPSAPKPGSKRADNTRKVALAQAYCVWSDVDEVVRIYMACAIINELGWGHYRVDHIVPLSSKLVCGLHTHTNLQVITCRENQAKGNHFWPGMPEYSWETIDQLLVRS